MSTADAEISASKEFCNGVRKRATTKVGIPDTACIALLDIDINSDNTSLVLN